MFSPIVRAAFLPDGGKVRMRTTAYKPELEALWHASANYAEMAAKTLITELPEEDADPETALELVVLRLKTGFLFPLLHEVERLLLEEAYLQTKIVTTGVNFEKGKISEALLTDAELSYLEARQTVRSKLFGKITDVQKEIVNEYYFTVRFTDE